MVGRLPAYRCLLPPPPALQVIPTTSLKGGGKAWLWSCFGELGQGQRIGVLVIALGDAFVQLCKPLSVLSPRGQPCA